ncbi:hypothetical protein KC332_g11238 [Hortaea werneckii]|uniref:BTB domain-containing protein n=2 Tax=Hortaea werneckii TaxID=91943 RepID=A0A3M7ICD7_HORWE|nr:hypothetical protein KC350_g12570 [Hortaea werneckii]OTA37623.1 hypothetical protein BTJ68_04424 [Hortaea werneckii EXF-2000]KAI6820695.1 hypothetical protein KC358_g9357 [Hortaea werneckii]KAI6916537.1 hypothetical protein KC348_g11523 [Hortaea werneckii]KAI6928489.1 hypothetical protein KC341_g11486 [Hortaea werneckii]
MSGGQHASNEALQKLLDTGEYSDLTIKCGDRTFQVHKNIICTRSEYFAAACVTGTIELQSSADPNAAKDDPSLDDPDAVKLMIDFLYLHDYVAIETCFSETLNASNKRPFGATNGDPGAIMHAKVYALGCKYQIPSLQRASLKKFEVAAALAWATDEFMHAVHLIYSTTPDSDKGLRDVAARVILEHDDELCNKPAMEAVIRSFDGLSYSLMKEQTKRPKKSKGPTCLTCGKVRVQRCSGGCGGIFVCCDCYDKDKNGGVYSCPQCLQRRASMR